MARCGLDKNRKFLRLAHALNGAAPGLGVLVARGALETLWDAAYDRADDHLGDEQDVEMAAKWGGEPGALFEALLHAGGSAGLGFIEPDPVRGGYRLHALWEHAPRWVLRKAEGAAKREEVGVSVSDLRRSAAEKRWSGSKRDANGHDPMQTGAVLDANGMQKTGRDREGKGREGKGRDLKSLAAAPPPPPPRPAPEPLELLSPEPAAAGNPDQAPDNPARFSCTREQALEALALASSGRFVASRPDRGGVFKLDRLRREPEALERLRLAGEWLAAGGDGYKATLDGRALGANLDGWLAQSAAWLASGRPAIGPPRRAGAVVGMAPPSPAPASYGIE